MSDGLKVLVIDDEMQIRKLLRVVLSAHGYVVEEEKADGMESFVRGCQNLILLLLTWGCPI